MASIYHLVYSDNVLSARFPPSDQADLKVAQFYLANDPQYKLVMDKQVCIFFAYFLRGKKILWSSIRPLNVTAYTTISPGTHTFVLQPQANSEEIFSLRNVNVQGGKNYI